MMRAGIERSREEVEGEREEVRRRMGRDTLFRPHLTIMSSTIYMYRSVHKKNPIKIGERDKLVWGKNEYVLTHTWFSGGKIQYILIFLGGNLSICSFFRGGN
jgi:hypothetical protein